VTPHPSESHPISLSPCVDRGVVGHVDTHTHTHTCTHRGNFTLTFLVLFCLFRSCKLLHYIMAPNAYLETLVCVRENVCVCVCARARARERERARGRARERARESARARERERERERFMKNMFFKNKLQNIPIALHMRSVGYKTLKCAYNVCVCVRAYTHTHTREYHVCVMCVQCVCVSVCLCVCARRSARPRVRCGLDTLSWACTCAAVTRVSSRLCRVFFAIFAISARARAPR
jgi:hypothetical protein